MSLHKHRIYGVLASMDNDPFNYINGKKTLDAIDSNGITNDDFVLSMGASWTQLMIVCGLIGVVITALICIIKLMIYGKNPQKTVELKQALITKCLIAGGISAFVSLAGLVFEIVRSMVV